MTNCPRVDYSSMDFLMDCLPCLAQSTQCLPYRWLGFPRPGRRSLRNSKSQCRRLFVSSFRYPCSSSIWQDDQGQYNFSWTFRCVETASASTSAQVGNRNHFCDYRKYFVETTGLLIGYAPPDCFALILHSQRIWGQRQRPRIFPRRDNLIAQSSKS